MVVAQHEGSHLTLALSGRFTFAIYKDFFAAYKELPTVPTSVDVDLGEVEYIDSSALGMLLAMRNHVGPEATVRLLNATGTVRKILEMASFEKAFVIE